MTDIDSIRNNSLEISRSKLIDNETGEIKESTTPEEEMGLQERKVTDDTTTSTLRSSKALLNSLEENDEGVNDTESTGDSEINQDINSVSDTNTFNQADVNSESREIENMYKEKLKALETNHSNELIKYIENNNTLKQLLVEKDDEISKLNANQEILKTKLKSNIDSLKGKKTDYISNLEAKEKHYEELLAEQKSKYEDIINNIRETKYNEDLDARYKSM